MAQASDYELVLSMVLKKGGKVIGNAGAGYPDISYKSAVKIQGAVTGSLQALGEARAAELDAEATA